MQYSVLAAWVLVVSVSSLPFDTRLDGSWNKYKVDYNKQYSPEDEVARRMIWESNLRYIQQHNNEAAQGLHTFTLAVNDYADMLSSEFVSMMNGYRRNDSSVGAGLCFLYTYSADVTDLPDTVDWRKQGYVTDVKNQGQCGSCWAFSATGSLEGQNFKKTGKLVSLSEKNLMDCSAREGKKGCDGGLMDYAFTYVIFNRGIDTEESYPYIPVTYTCQFNRTNVGAKATGCKDIWKGSEKDLQNAVATEGPISVGIDASNPSFQFYQSGVYYEEQCSSHSLDHGVLVVGYGTEQGKDYWLVKNSWGVNWGLDGYIMMSRNRENNCGIATDASFPTM